MKRLLLIPVVLMSCIGFSQTWTDGKGLVAKYHSFKMVHSPNQAYDFSLAGSVTVDSTPQGLDLSSDTMQIHATPDPKNPKSYLVQHAVSVGKVILVKTVRSKGGNQVTRIDGSKADYTSGVSESIVKMAGPMKIQSFDELKRPTMVATGNFGIATLEPLTQSNMDHGLRKATMDGSVKLVLTQIDAKTAKVTTIRTTSDHMVMENQATGKKVTLTGAVTIAGDNVGEMKGMNTAVFHIAKNGDFQLMSQGAK